MAISYIDKLETSPSVATMRLYGAIGEKVDGDYFAQELSMISRDCEKVRLRINSPGGDVISGMSIVSAILSSYTPIEVYIDGVAASMAAVIAVCGDKVYMADYAKIMIHDPHFANDTALTAKQKKQICKMRDMIGQILSRRGKNIDQISALMAAETWYSATEALAEGLCDEIVSSAKSLMVGLTPMQVLSQVDLDYYNKTNKKTMKLKTQVFSILGLSAEAPDDDISAAIEKINSEKLSIDKLLKEALMEKAKSEKTLSEMVAAKAAEQKVEAEALVEAAVKDGRINADGKAAILGVFAHDHAAGKATLSAIPVHRTITSQLLIDGKAVDGLRVRTWDELDRSGELALLKEQHPDAYQDKFNAKFYPGAN
ncbi:MAG: ATP-dependent Clp protease proteolytic subunit [Mucinivorans sp.]